MANLGAFDANQVDPSVQFDPLPAGRYPVIVVESEMKATKAGTGRYLQLTFQVIEGELQGRLVWTRLNLENSNEMAVKVARAELSALCRAVGVMQPRDSVELHNKPLEITVGLKRRDDSGEFKSVVKGYRKRGSPAVGAGQSSAPRAMGSAPPWKR